MGSHPFSPCPFRQPTPACAFLLLQAHRSKSKSLSLFCGALGWQMPCPILAGTLLHIHIHTHAEREREREREECTPCTPALMMNVMMSSTTCHCSENAPAMSLYWFHPSTGDGAGDISGGEGSGDWGARGDTCRGTFRGGWGCSVPRPFPSQPPALLHVKMAMASKSTWNLSGPPGRPSPLPRTVQFHYIQNAWDNYICYRK